MNITNEDLAKGIAFQIERGTVTENNRQYLGMSQLGHPCTNYLWHYFRWTRQQSYSHRTKRIFARGNLEEPRIIETLKRIGIDVVNRQLELEDFNGHLQGHTDGESYLEDIDENVVNEFKTMAQKYYDACKKNGLKKAHKAYWIQGLLYMYYTGKKKVLFIATNKNTEEYYIEVFDSNAEIAEQCVHRASQIINSKVPLQRCSEDPNYFQCKAFKCPYYGPCWEDENYDKNCRTCQNSSPATEGRWYCSEHDKFLTVEEQREGCDSFNMLKV